MQKHNVVRTHKNKTSTQVGRGGTRGKTSGRGTKGQNARAGHKNRPELRDFIKRFPKLRGRGKNSNTSIQQKPVIISLSQLSAAFADGSVITTAALIEKGLVSMRKGKMPVVKVLGGSIKDKSIDKKLTLDSTSSNISISGKAKEVFEKAGGKVA
jgi:large subunit ribosomal protein L15